MASGSGRRAPKGRRDGWVEALTGRDGVCASRHGAGVEGDGPGAGESLAPGCDVP